MLLLFKLNKYFYSELYSRYYFFKLFMKKYYIMVIFKMFYFRVKLLYILGKGLS